MDCQLLGVSDQHQCDFEFAERPWVLKGPVTGNQLSPPSHLNAPGEDHAVRTCTESQYVMISCDPVRGHADPE